MSFNVKRVLFFAIFGAMAVPALTGAFDAARLDDGHSGGRHENIARFQQDTTAIVSLRPDVHVGGDVYGFGVPTCSL